MSKTLNGRKPFSSKGKPAPMNVLTDDIFGNTLSIPPEIQKELKDKGLVGRFVRAGLLYANQGYHPKGWRAYKRDAGAKVEGVEFKTGSDPEGLVRRGDCILAVKTVEEHEKHVNWLEAKADRYKGYSKRKQKELQDYAQDAGVKTLVDEGYDGDEGEDDEQD